MHQRVHRRVAQGWGDQSGSPPLFIAGVAAEVAYTNLDTNELYQLLTS
jgi:hypothetical protein